MGPVSTQMYIRLGWGGVDSRLGFWNQEVGGKKEVAASVGGHANRTYEAPDRNLSGG